MQEDYIKWYSPNLSAEFEMLTFGHSGLPLLLFPTSKGRYYENKDFKLIESISYFIESGRVKVYCPDGIDALSWYNTSVHPADRVKNHIWYDKMLLEEVVPQAKQETGCSKVITAGCSFGGYHAANFAFRHPWTVSHLFSMSGAFDIRGQLDGFYNDDVYFNNPVDFLPNDHNPELWNLKIVLGSADRDICRADNERLSGILNQKQIRHWLDIRPNAEHDWVIWRQMFPEYLSQL
ncbi:esterase family protein [Pedobacter nutrimenti]|jgi:esterase/lipase superfamily enzyme|uniref:Esterase/lipase superfamily enzyme n=1 Tax=Pedobacter nutrimenti TaxID=1241337 RepID=A0A318UGL7_9SPHI|nr:esterase family protein [Pedobacter nutrimenti]PYF75536.1 esterase/lipase superfamily enzyme [Pedobacter nutrimenti]